jgi:hypothetical protein
MICHLNIEVIHLSGLGTRHKPLSIYALLNQTKMVTAQPKAVKYLCPTKPDKDGYGTTKKGARIQILEVNEVPTD